MVTLVFRSTPSAALAKHRWNQNARTWVPPGSRNPTLPNPVPKAPVPESCKPGGLVVNSETFLLPREPPANTSWTVQIPPETQQLAIPPPDLHLRPQPYDTSQTSGSPGTFRYLAKPSEPGAQNQMCEQCSELGVQTPLKRTSVGETRSKSKETDAAYWNSKTFLLQRKWIHHLSTDTLLNLQIYSYQIFRYLFIVKFFVIKMVCLSHQLALQLGGGTKTRLSSFRSSARAFCSSVVFWAMARSASPMASLKLGRSQAFCLAKGSHCWPQRTGGVFFGEKRGSSSKLHFVQMFWLSGFRERVCHLVYCHIICNPTNHTIQLGETDHFPWANGPGLKIYHPHFFGLAFPSTHSPPPSPAPTGPHPGLASTPRRATAAAMRCFVSLRRTRPCCFCNAIDVSSTSASLGWLREEEWPYPTFFEAFFKLCGCFWQEKKTAVEIFRALHNSCSLLVESHASLKGWKGHTASIDRHRWFTI